MLLTGAWIQFISKTTYGAFISLINEFRIVFRIVTFAWIKISILLPLANQMIQSHQSRDQPQGCDKSMYVPVNVLIDSGRLGVCVGVEIIHFSACSLLGVLRCTLTISWVIYIRGINVRCGLSRLESKDVRVYGHLDFICSDSDFKLLRMDMNRFCQLLWCTVKCSLKPSLPSY